VELHVDAARTKKVRERLVGTSKRVVAADVDPDRQCAVRIQEGEVEDVVAREVVRVVERTRRRVPGVLPQRRRVTADGAELSRLADGEEEGPKPPIEIPPMAMRPRTVSNLCTASGSASSRIIDPHRPSRRSW
jgi:hypothetical protein